GAPGLLRQPLRAGAGGRRRLPGAVGALARCTPACSAAKAAPRMAHSDRGRLPMPAEACDFALVAHHDLAGAGNGGEGLVLQVRPDGRRIFYIAHESAPMAASILDVTNPRQPELLCQLPVEHPRVPGNSPAVVDHLLLVARQVA